MRSPRLAFVVQRYGADIAAGAEFHCRLVAEDLARRAEVTVLTTCAQDYVSWANALPAGESELRGVRVRRFELRLVGAALVAGWTVAAALVVLAYRPGGPLDILVGLTLAFPILIAIVGTIWPPVTRGGGAFAAMVWLGIAAILFLLPSIIGLIEQLQAMGTQTLLPSIEAAYPWFLALAATSLFSGFGLSRRLRGATALRRRRFVDGALIALVLLAASATLFAGAAVANELAVRDTVRAASRFGPTTPGVEPPLCDGMLVAGPAARLRFDLTATVDLRPIGTVDGTGVRSGDDFRWSAYVATHERLGLAGAARIGEAMWGRDPGGSWDHSAATWVGDSAVDRQVVTTALTPGNRLTAEDRGMDVLEGARARRCRVAIDGATFVAAFPQVGWLVGGTDLHRWRGELDYWVFADGQLGQVIGSASGEAIGIDPDGLIGEIAVNLTATERDRDLVVYPPGP
jgi:hypothetical protein